MPKIRECIHCEMELIPDQPQSAVLAGRSTNALIVSKSTAQKLPSNIWACKPEMVRLLLFPSWPSSPQKTESLIPRLGRQ